MHPVSQCTLTQVERGTQLLLFKQIIYVRLEQREQHVLSTTLQADQTAFSYCW